MSERPQTPEEVEEDIRSGKIALPEPVEAVAAMRQLCLSMSSGTFKVEWSVTTGPDKYDWVGLYSSPDADDRDYIDGAWKWAVDGSPYLSRVGVTPGCQARYLVWDSSVKMYVSVARTGAFPSIVANSTLVEYPRKPTTDEWSEIKSNYPNLSLESCWVTDPETKRYNCIAWSLGLDDRWINPSDSLPDFQAQYQKWGYQAVTKLSPNATIDGWGTSTLNCTHASKLYTGVSVGKDGLWESKCGATYRITHVRDGLTSQDTNGYGSIIVSFVPGASVIMTHPEVLQMNIVRTLTEDEFPVLAAAMLTVPGDIAATFETAFQAWKDTWFTGETRISNNTHDLAQGVEYERLKSLSEVILPLLIDKLRDPLNFPALILYDELQPSRELVIRYGEDDPVQFEGEQARAARTVLQWVTAQAR